jgi:hypothetical protein
MHKAVAVRRISAASIADLHESLDTTTHMKLLEPAAKNETLSSYNKTNEMH